MYSFEPTQEQRMLVDAIHRYANDDIRPSARDADEDATISTDLIKKGWELGFLQASIPGDYGGFGERSALTGALAAEEIAWGDLSTAMAVFVPNLYSLPILIAGSETQKTKYIPDVIEMEWKPYTAALMEQSFAFDVHDLQTTAVKTVDGYTINGKKSYVPYALDAAGLIVYANLDGETQGFIIPGHIDGLQLGKRQELLGLNALPLYELTLSDVKVSKESRLGGSEGHDFSIIQSYSNVALASMALGVARAALEYSVEYAKDREVFGVKVAQKQAIAFMIAEMATELESIRLLTWEAAWMLDNDRKDASKQAYLAATGAADMVMMVTDRAVQILGGHGYIREHPVEMWMRNGRGFAAFSGLALI